jgi:RimJ/RimL family protein N-acetyltransferase
MTIIPFQPEHLAQINLQATQRRTIAHMTSEWLAVLAHRGPAISVIVDGEIIASGGLVLQSSRCGFVWAAFSHNAGRYFLGLHRAARRLLTLAPTLDRIEAVTEVDFAQGRRWLELLGFRCEGRLPKDGPKGDDHFKYVLDTGAT